MTEGKDRGLILGGGGVAGLAWEIGVLCGLASAGVDVGNADEVIGTSAGAFAGAALLDERGIAWAYQRQLDLTAHELSADISPEVFEGLARILRSHLDDERLAGRLIGQFALAAKTVAPPERMAVVCDRLDRDDWPSSRLKVTAVDADTGELVLLGRASNIALADAAAASGAAPGIWPVVEAGRRRWIDGGSVSVTNASLAARFNRCLVLSPLTLNLSGVSVQEQLDVLHETASTLVTPDGDSAQAIGTNPFDADRRRPAAEAGRRQGEAIAHRVEEFWRAVGGTQPAD